MKIIDAQPGDKISIIQGGGSVSSDKSLVDFSVSIERIVVNSKNSESGSMHVTRISSDGWFDYGVDEFYTEPHLIEKDRSILATCYLLNATPEEEQGAWIKVLTLANNVANVFENPQSSLLGAITLDDIKSATNCEVDVTDFIDLSKLKASFNIKDAVEGVLEDAGFVEMAERYHDMTGHIDDLLPLLIVSATFVRLTFTGSQRPHSAPAVHGEKVSDWEFAQAMLALSLGGKVPSLSSEMPRT